MPRRGNPRSLHYLSCALSLAHAHRVTTHLCRPPHYNLRAAAAFRQRQHIRAIASSSSGHYSSSPVQAVYELAARGDLEGARTAMDALTPEIVGLRAGGPEGSPGAPIGYHPIYSDDLLSISIFVLPAGACIPLHDHPGMTVLSKILFGALDVTSYDMPGSMLTPPKPPNPFDLFGGGGGKKRSRRRLLCEAASRRSVAAPCPTLRLDAGIGNIHEFTAREHTAIFDVLTPPYNEFAGRSCHYYRENESAEGDGERRGDSKVELLEIGWPPSLRIVNRPYEGEPVAR